MMIIDDEFEASLSLPTGARDLPLLIADRSFDKRNQLTDPFRAHAHAPNDGIVGKLWRWSTASTCHSTASTPPAIGVRVLNAANFALYNLELSNGDRMTQIATESGLMPAPVARRQALIGPGERVELILDFSKLRGQAGRAAERQAQRRAAGSPRRPIVGPLVEFRVGAAARRLDRDPGALRPLPGVGRRRPGTAAAQVGVHDLEGPGSHLADQRQDLRSRALRRVRRSSARPRPGSCTTAPPSRT